MHARDEDKLNTHPAHPQSGIRGAAPYEPRERGSTGSGKRPPRAAAQPERLCEVSPSASAGEKD